MKVPWAGRLARQLVYEGLIRSTSSGYAVACWAIRRYIAASGFELAAHYDLHRRWPGTESAFRAHRLAEDAGVRDGLVYITVSHRFKALGVCAGWTAALKRRRSSQGAPSGAL